MRELKTRASEVLRQVREEGTEYGITHRGKVIARLTPVGDMDDSPLTSEQWLEEWDQLSEEIEKHTRGPVDAVELVREGRTRW